MDRKKVTPPPPPMEPRLQEMLDRLIAAQQLRQSLQRAAALSDSPMGNVPAERFPMMVPPEIPMSRGDVLSFYGNPRRQSIADKMNWGRN